MNNLFVKLSLTFGILILTSCTEKSPNTNPLNKEPIHLSAQNPDTNADQASTSNDRPKPSNTVAQPSSAASTTPNNSASTSNAGGVRAPLLNAPSFPAQTLAQRFNSLWIGFKNETYETSRKNTVTGITTTKRYKYLPSDAKIAYCFPDYKNEQIFSNYDPYHTGLEIASVSKIFTSLWAIESRKKNYVLLPKQFKTQVSFDPDTGELFLRGTLDPLFGIDRLQDALDKVQKALKAEGFVQKVSVQKIHIYNFIQLPILTSQTGYEMVVNEHARALGKSPALTTKSLTSVSKYLQKTKNSFFKNTNFDRFEVINHSDFYEFEDAAATAPVTITSFQRPLNQVLFFVNSFSHNLGADLIYQLLGGKEEFINFLVDYFPANLTPVIRNGEEDLSQHLGYDTHVPFIFYNGSGLPQLLTEQANKARSAKSLKVTAFTEATEDQFGEEFGNSRFRNKATCEIIFKTIEGLYDSKSFFKTNLEEIMAINGNGTLHRAVSKDVPMGTFVGKTGSLNNLMALAGALKTPYGLRPFFISVFRNNLDQNGQYRPNAMGGEAAKFFRSKVTTELVKQMKEYYTQQGIFMPQASLLSQMNVETFLAKSYDSVTDLSAIP